MSSDNVIAFNPVSPPSPDLPICRVSYKATPLLDLYRFTDWYPREYVVIPDYLLKPAERELAARTFKPKDDEDARIFAEVRTQIKNRTQGYAARREIEGQIAEYLDLNRLYPEVVAKLRKCRQSGCYGYRKNERGENEPIMAWDKKCNLVRLCPDESRQETRRLAERYVPNIAAWQKEKAGRQIQYCVLTWPNIKPGGLAIAKRWMFSHLNRWLKGKSCKAVKGCLAVQEDPLAADGTWNVHINLILEIEGHFDWKIARAAWFQRAKDLFPHQYKDFQVHFERVQRGPASQTRAVMELVKYSAKHVSKKHFLENEVDVKDPRNLRARSAPAITDWPPARFEEWWEAGMNFRRTRSYGALYNVPDQERELKFEEVTWCGRLEYNPETRTYKLIDLIQADNSALPGAAADNSRPNSGHDPPR